ncbi:MAG: site-specific integrase, partial [Nitrososphaeraceae archaeon]
MQALEDNLFSNFINSLKSPETKKNYSYALKKYMDFHSMTKYSDLMLADREDKIKHYVIYLSNKGVSKSWFMLLFSSLKNFYEMNDVEDIKWKKLKRYAGEDQPKHEDRRYMDEEIHKLVQNANLKLKATILLMASSGVRIGAVPLLLKGHLERRGDLYKISVYKGQKGKGQYYTFCTPEAAKAIDNYLEFRERCGEKINPQSPLFRKDFDVNDQGQARFDVQNWKRPRILEAIHKELIKNGLITVDHTKYNRKEVKLSHGFRKFFETMLVNANLHETIIRKLTGHSPNNNLTQLYSKQTESEMLDEYLKAVDNLTINPENRLK